MAIKPQDSNESTFILEGSFKSSKASTIHPMEDKIEAEIESIIMDKISTVKSIDRIEIVKKPKNKKRIILNARGFKYQIMICNLEKAHPGSRLGRLYELITAQLLNDKNMFKTSIKEDVTLELNNICDDFDLSHSEFYFDRDPYVLNLILNGLVIDQLHCLNNNYCINLLTEELKYWNIKRFNIQSCCLVEVDNQQEAIDDELKREQLIIDEVNSIVDFGEHCYPKIREKIWLIMEDPTSSPWSLAYMIVYCIIIALSTIEIVFRTLTVIRDDKGANIAFDVIEIISIVWFTIQIIFRFILAPKKLRFFFSVMNIIDILSVIPFFIHLIAHDNDYLFRIKKIARVFRILTIFKIIGQTRAKTLSDTLKYSYREIGVYLIYLSVGILIFSCLVYYCEYDVEKSNFTSIPATFWWAIITMTTVGYGDMAPTTILGKLVGGICALSGIIIIAMPVGLLSTNFSVMYEASEKKKILIERYKKSEGKKLTIQSQEDDI